MPLNDAEIRGPLRNWIRLYRTPNLLADEVPVREGRAMMDLAAYYPAGLHAYEIKGQTDRLVRLKNQVKYYGHVCTACTVVVFRTHLKKIEKHVPEWWEIVEVRRVDWSDEETIEGLSFTIHREGKPNPQRDLYQMLYMLWKSEMMELVEKYTGKAPPIRTSKGLLILRLQKIFQGPDHFWRQTFRYFLERKNNLTWAETHLRG
jgi:hypothetical protein